MVGSIELGRHLSGKRMLLGVEIFSTGTHQPANGPAHTWTSDDLDNIVAAFNAGVPEVVHVKLGHTSPEFAQLIAQKLGVPTEVVTGEDPGGDGLISLGRVATLRRRQTKLVADLEVPDPVAEIVMKGFSTVSSELMDNFEGHETVLVAIALLGAERPAVKDLEGLAAAAVLTERRPTLVYAFKSEENVIMANQGQDLDAVEAAFETAMSGPTGAAWLRQKWGGLKGRMESLLGKPEHTEDDMDLKDMAAKLKMQEGASAEEIGSFIDELTGALSQLREMLGLGAEATPADVEEAARTQLKATATFKEGAGKALPRHSRASSSVNTRLMNRSLHRLRTSSMRPTRTRSIPMP